MLFIIFFFWWRGGLINKNLVYNKGANPLKLPSKPMSVHCQIVGTYLKLRERRFSLTWGIPDQSILHMYSSTGKVGTSKFLDSLSNTLCTKS